MATTKSKLTIYLTPEVARATRVRAARTEQNGSELIESALRKYLGLAALDESQNLSTLSDEEAMELANSEVHAYRKERSAKSRS